ncbi:WhiB family transcriptional regulator [Pseudonocardia lutea]|uniref:Transcriptional regulator WhiB n=1 Tax=Pseudonocardia lutea TaxID=2172015 RepID=A0ABW1I7N2_9PSEU
MRTIAGALAGPAAGGTAAGPAELLPTELPCHGADAGLWFADDPTDLDRAKVACAGCPMRAECLAGALRRREPWGVWGGEIFRDGEVVPVKRGPGRPRKHPR